ncbi:MAG TPA: PVC-type heme-binding CxxCH protein [Cyclobacteriaceae bacterium]|nr:PVC-type heme-binding CxxCH protein [Cyclobacteriaceae bacterium]
MKKRFIHKRTGPPIAFIFFILFSCAEKEPVPPGFRIEPGFELTLVASEPLIIDPIDLEFTERGDAMVLEMPGYPFSDQQGRIVMLKDNDQDGVYDERILFAENLLQATSILPFREGLLVAAPPFLLYLKDEDGNNHADAADTLMAGFSTGNLQHNYNGLTYGVDNWIYAANGGNSGDPYWWNDTTTVMSLHGQDLRFDADRRVMQRVGKSSGGFGLAMDDWGHFFETHNLRHVSHLVFQDRYIDGTRLMRDHTLSNISDHEENGLARIYPIGEQESRVNHPEQSGYFSGSCGITYYGGRSFGPEYEQTVWVADVVLNLIHVDKIKDNGASLTASRVMEQRDFLASTDRSFRPVNLATGPDGSLYVVDMYRKVIEHPEWIPDEIEKTLDLNAGKDKGRIYRISKINSGLHSPDLTLFKTVEGNLEALNSPNQWVRMTAQRLLVDGEMNDIQVQNLKKFLQNTSPFTRLHALWILNAKEKLEGTELITALDDSSPGVRENALIVAEKYLSANENLIDKCLALCSDPDQRVRMQVALTLSTLGRNDFERVSDKILGGLAQSAAKSMDEWNTYAITLASRYAPEELFNRLSRLKEVHNHVLLLSSLAMVCGGDQRGMTTVLQTLSHINLNEGGKSEIVNSLAKGVTSNLSVRSLVPFIQNLEATGGLTLVSSLANLRKKIGLPASPQFLNYSKDALQKVLDHSQPDSIREEQLPLLEFLPYEAKADVLFQCLKNTEPLKIQKEAIHQLSTFDDPRIGRRLVENWKEFGPQTRRLAGDVLLFKKVHHDALLTGLEKGVINIGEMNFDLERRRTLLWWSDNDDTKRRAEALFSDAGVLTRQEAFDKMKDALTLKGSPDRGVKIFQTVCINCHVYGSHGENVGPVLTEIGRKSQELLMHDILDPNAAVDTRYINHRLETKSGEVHMGIVDVETDQFITIKKMGGASVTVDKKDIKNFESLGTSLMMEGLETNMTPQDMADLLAFLQTGKSE